MRRFIEAKDGSSNNKIEVGIFKDAPDVENLKSHNHNDGVTLPQRQFIPHPGEEFKKTIINKINRVVADIVAGTG